jgi:hypothetical protein
VGEKHSHYFKQTIPKWREKQGWGGGWMEYKRTFHGWPQTQVIANKYDGKN